jgi:glycine/D-amino acid oxidase-like deaminating enzyme
MPDVSVRPVSANAHAPDVAIVGGGIIGCALAAFLAEDGARVRLYEREEIAAGASGRNSGLLQHPMDEALTGLFATSQALYGELGHGFELPAERVGVLVVSEDAAALEPTRADLAARFPELRAEALDPAALHAAEPALAEGLAGFRLDTGHPVPPAAATQAFAARARAAGADLLEGTAATPATANGRATGVRTAGGEAPAGAVVVAAGPWSSALVDPTGEWRPVAPLWGVNVELRLAQPPRHAVEEGGIEDLIRADGGLSPLFSLVTREGVSALGSTFLSEKPEPTEVAPALVERGTRFVPALAGTHVVSVRACARPMSIDGRPLLGPLAATEGLFVAAGHGPWGVSLGPGSARLVADAVLGRESAIAPELAAARFQWVSS